LCQSRRALSAKICSSPVSSICSRSHLIPFFFSWRCLCVIFPHSWICGLLLALVHLVGGCFILV
jgi:hypothetical protein